MADQFLGEIRIFGFNFAPVNWAFCDGQLMPISQNTALFSILGTNFGGNGVNTFGLPRLIGNVPVGAGTGPGLSQRDVGETGGSQYVTLTNADMPQHSHSVLTFARPGNKKKPDSTTVPARSSPDAYVAATAGQAAVLNASTLSPGAGGGNPHYNVMPSLSVNFCIALSGLFPPRS